MLAECLLAWARGGEGEERVDAEVAALVLAGTVLEIRRQLGLK